MNDLIDRAISLLRSSSRTVCFTGAGISTESGIPDFRSPDGIWSKSQPVLYEDFLASPAARVEYWSQKQVAHHDFRSASPNVAHRALACWEANGLLAGVITQNIDGLHQQAGSRNVLELHGTAREIGCLDCGYREPADRLVDEFARTGIVPDCPECGGLLKHCTISFGQSLDHHVLEAAAAWAMESDVFLVLGSSLVVEPAASLPVLAHNHGARIMIINRDPTPLDRLAEVRIESALGPVMSQIHSALEAQSGG